MKLGDSIMSNTPSHTSRAKLIALISTDDVAAPDAPSTYAVTQTTTAPKIKPTTDLLELSTNEMVPSASRTTLQTAFQTMRTQTDTATQGELVHKSRIEKLAAEAVQDAVTKSCQTQVEHYLDKVLPSRTDAMFETTGERRVKAAVLRLAPTQIVRVVQEMAPELVETAVLDHVEKAVTAEIVHIATALKGTVHQMVRKELHGAFGEKVTSNIKALIQSEFERMIAEQDV